MPRRGSDRLRTSHWGRSPLLLRNGENRRLTRINPRRMVDEEAVLSFVRSSIKSAWSLELLLLLRRDPDRSWDREALVRELRGSIPLVNESLGILSAAGLVAVSEAGSCIYAPQSGELDALVSALVDLYSQKPITVLRTIFTSPMDRIKSFSDAFYLKKK
jgi:hypothetical protein